MADDRLYLLCSCGEGCFLAKHFSNGWVRYDRHDVAYPLRKFLDDHVSHFSYQDGGRGQYRLVQEDGMLGAKRWIVNEKFGKSCLDAILARIAEIEAFEATRDYPSRHVPALCAALRASLDSSGPYDFTDVGKALGVEVKS